jgi:hypothetical protein
MSQGAEGDFFRVPQTLLGRNLGILSRLRNLKPIEPKLRRLFEQGKREHLMTGRSATMTPFQPLARSTLAEPRQSPMPLLKHGPSSSIITRYELSFAYKESSLIISAGWPMKWVRYHQVGGPHLPRRDPGGFRREDLRESARILREWVMNAHA